MLLRAFNKLYAQVIVAVIQLYNIDNIDVNSCTHDSSNAAIHDDPTPFEHPLAPWPSGPARTTCCRSAGAGIPPGRWRGPWGPGAFHGSRPTTSSLLAIRPANCIKMHQLHQLHQLLCFKAHVLRSLGLSWSFWVTVPTHPHILLCVIYHDPPLSPNTGSGHAS